jgi:DNA-binding transcriptional LysR family regulator
MPVSIFTETLGGSEQRLREGVAHFATFPRATTGAGDLTADFLASIDVVPVVSVDHPLAREPGRSRARPSSRMCSSC